MTGAPRHLTITAVPVSAELREPYWPLGHLGRRAGLIAQADPPRWLPTVYQRVRQTPPLESDLLESGIEPPKTKLCHTTSALTRAAALGLLRYLENALRSQAAVSLPSGSESPPLCRRRSSLLDQSGKQRGSAREVIVLKHVVDGEHPASCIHLHLEALHVKRLWQMQDRRPHPAC